MQDYNELSVEELYEEIQRLMSKCSDWLTYLSEMVSLSVEENAELDGFIVELNHALGR